MNEEREIAGLVAPTPWSYDILTITGGEVEEPWITIVDGNGDAIAEMTENDSAEINAAFIVALSDVFDISELRGWYLASDDEQWFLCGPETCKLPDDYKSGRDSLVDGYNLMMDADQWFRDNVDEDTDCGDCVCEDD